MGANHRFDSHGITFLYIILTLYISCLQVSSYKVVVDVASDLTYGWKVQGEYIYVPKGEQLAEFSGKIPPSFPFESVSSSRGIWVILPRWSPVSSLDNVTLWTNRVTFSYSTAAQLLDSVTVRHNSGGHAIINIITGKENYTQTPEQMFPNFVDISVPISGNRFTIECSAVMEHDYILIDKIEAHFVETTTSTRRPRTSTTVNPQPITGGQPSLFESSCHVLIAILISYKFIS